MTPNPDQISRLLRERRTVHEFTDQMVPWPELEQALESACFAPNHYFTQPWRFYRVGSQTKHAIVQLNADLIRASKGEDAAEKKMKRWSQVPGWLIVTSQTSRDSLRQREDYAACCCAVQNLMLDLWARGIGSKWTTGAVTRDPRFFRLIGIKPQHEQLVALLWYGYPASVPKPVRSPLHSRLRHLP